MATPRNKRKLAALNKENCAEHFKSHLVQNSNITRSQENYITQVSDKMREESSKSCRKSLAEQKTAY